MRASILRKTNLVIIATTLTAITLTTIASAQAVQAPTQGKAPPSHHLVKVTIKDARYLTRLLKLDLDMAGCGVPEAGTKQVEIVTTDADLVTLRQAGFKFEMMQRNIEDHYEAEMKRQSLGRPETLSPPLGQGAMGGHWTLAQMEAILDGFAKDYPSLCSKKASIGKSIEGRDLWMVKISDNVGQDEAEPEVFYDALHHAREPLSMETTIVFMEELLAGYGKDKEATFLVNERELFFVPCVNPEGYEHNRALRPNGGGMWRKNRRPNGGGSYGIDLNRNYATGWSAPNGGNSTNPNSDVYRGTAPFSEPETLAIENFIKTRSFVQICSCHTYTEILLQPWGYKPGVTSNSAEYDLIGDRMTAANPMQRGGISTILYTAAGGSIDHHHAVHGAFGWSPELGKSSEGGFWPAGQNIINIARRHQPMFRAMALTSGALLSIDSFTVSEVSGNSNGTIEPGETGGLVVKVQNAGANATVGPASVQITSKSPGVTVLVGNASLGIVAKFGSALNSGTPLTFRVPSNYTAKVVDIEIALLGDGLGTKETHSISLLPIRTVLSHNMEADRGFSRGAGGTATTGRWERAAPNATSYQGNTFQPGSQHTPGGRFCWVTDGRSGSSAGTYDVDSGYTDLLSPVIDLSHLGLAQLEFYRYYAESQGNDDMQVSVSRDGGSNWSSVFTSSSSTNGWVKFQHKLAPPLTRQMRFRVRAQDLQASLVECLIDDFEIRGSNDNGNITLLSSGVPGSTLQLGVNGSNGASATLLLGTTLIAGIPIPGIGGKLMVDPASTLLLTGYSFGASGFTPVDLKIPTLSGLPGKTFYWQALHIAGSRARFGNVQTITIR
ncbi:MAG: M14 family zinc carboxypeptidase [Planctomycetota bacterium]|nr:M14 family zinc carboxypeptidase [Planctomycetota bacterium]